MTDDQKEYFVAGMSHHTVRQTETSIRVFQKWLAKPPRNEQRSICHIMPDELDKYIGSFLCSLQKADGSDYEPDTLTSYHRGIDRYLRVNNYSFNILNDKEFAKSRAMLYSKRKELRGKGKGRRPNAAGSFGPCEEAILREKGILGTDDPEHLLNTVWLNNTVLFGIHRGSENRNLLWGDIQLKLTASGLEYIEYNMRLSKTRTVETKTERREICPKQFARADKNFCPVHAYKEYARHRPPHTFRPESPFYLSINHARHPGSNIWFKSQPMGENYLRTLMKNMAKKGGLLGRKTNHSVKKTNCAKLLQGDIAPTATQQFKCHNNAIASLEMQEQESGILLDNPGCETSPDIKPTLNQAIQIPSNTLPGRETSPDIKPTLNQAIQIPSNTLPGRETSPDIKPTLNQAIQIPCNTLPGRETLPGIKPTLNQAIQIPSNTLPGCETSPDIKPPLNQAIQIPSNTLPGRETSPDIKPTLNQATQTPSNTLPGRENLPDVKPPLNQSVQIPSNTLPSIDIADHSASLISCTNTIIDNEKSSDPKKRRIEP